MKFFDRNDIYYCQNNRKSNFINDEQNETIEKSVYFKSKFCQVPEVSVLNTIFADSDREKRW